MQKFQSFYKSVVFSTNNSFFPPLPEENFVVTLQRDIIGPCFIIAANAMVTLKTIKHGYSEITKKTFQQEQPDEDSVHWVGRTYQQGLRLPFCHHWQWCGWRIIKNSEGLLIPFIIRERDSIELSNHLTKKHGLTTILYRKTIGNQYVYVEEIRNGRNKSLAFVSLYKRPIKKASP